MEPVIHSSDATDELPLIISVDDHVLEPPTVWTDRISSRYADRMPRIIREKGLPSGRGDLDWTLDPDGVWSDVWHYEDVVRPLGYMFAAAGRERTTLDYGAQQMVTFDEFRPGAWKTEDRIADNLTNHTEVSVLFPNTIPRFCGQTFAEQQDKELGLLCVQAYNDWIIDEWTAGDARRHLVPLAIVPLWDGELAAAEIRRVNAKGCFGVSFSENPYALGLPSIHSGHWDPFFAACQEADTTICMHIGSSSRLPETAPDGPYPITSVLLAHNAAGSLLDYVLGGILERFPTIKLAYSEANVGWMPYIVERMDKIWLERGHDTMYGSDLPRLPSSYLADRVYGCIIDDEIGMRLRDQIGDKQICFETDFPHADSKWPDSKRYAERIIAAGGLDDAEIYAFLRGNAIKAFGMQRYGIER